MAPILKVKLDDETIESINKNKGGMKYAEFITAAVRYYIDGRSQNYGNQGLKTDIEEDIRAIKAILEQFDVRLSNMEGALERLLRKSEIAETTEDLTHILTSDNVKILRFEEEDEQTIGSMATNHLKRMDFMESTEEEGWYYVDEEDEEYEGSTASEGGAEESFSEDNYPNETYVAGYGYYDHGSYGGLDGYRNGYDLRDKRTGKIVDQYPSNNIRERGSVGYYSYDQSNPQYDRNNLPSDQNVDKVPEAECPFCGNVLTYVLEFGRYYCYNCERYINNPKFVVPGFKGKKKSGFFERLLYGT